MTRIQRLFLPWLVILGLIAVTATVNGYAQEKTAAPTITEKPSQCAALPANASPKHKLACRVRRDSKANLMLAGLSLPSISLWQQSHLSNTGSDQKSVQNSTQAQSGLAQPKPMMTNPNPGCNYYYTTPDEEQDAIDQCGDEGGVYNLETCGCDLHSDGGGGEPPLLPPSFAVAYSAYIPVDHVTGPSSCFIDIAGTAVAIPLIYHGDGGYGTYRVTESASFAPATSTASNFYGMTGITKNYGYGSPKNGSTLSSGDEDGVADDCYLWNESGQADYSGLTYSIDNNGELVYLGNSSNPLEPGIAPIFWSITTSIDTSNPSQPTATVSYEHTCYPAHQVKIGSTINPVYSYTPPSNDLLYITGCLAFGAGHVSGVTQPVAIQQ